MKKLAVFFGAALTLLAGTALADLSVKDGSGTLQTLFAFTCFTTKICNAHVNVDSAGAEIGVTANPLFTKEKDGDNVVLGSKADAKSTATDTTSITIMQVLKQISSSIQSAASSLSGTLTVASHAVTNAGTFSVQTSAQVPGTGATNEGKAEDAAHSSGDTGIEMLGVRKDTAAATAGTDGDYQPPISNARGALWIAIEDGAGGQVTSFSGPTQYTEDAAAAANPVGSMTMLRRKDTLSGSEVSTDGDNIAANATSKGEIYTHDTDSLAQLTTIATNSGSAVPAGSNSIGTVVASEAKAEDAASANADTGIPAMLIRKATPANTSGTDGDYENFQASGGYLWVHDNKGLANKAFTSTCTTNTRPANTTAYTAGDSISNNATAGSVTALSCTSVSDVNDDPIFISEAIVDSTDTGLGGKRIRAYLFNSDPTASSGVGGGDNAAFSQKKAGYIGSLSGVCETGFSDGTECRLVPSYNDSTSAPGQNAPAGSFIVSKPASGAANLWIEYQATDAFTPSSNSTTLIGTLKGWQARAN